MRALRHIYQDYSNFKISLEKKGIYDSSKEFASFNDRNY